MANNTKTLKLAMRQHLLAVAAIQSKVGTRVFGHHFTEDEAGTVEHPLVILELNNGGSDYNRVWSSSLVDVYTYSKEGDTEAAELYDLVYDALQAGCVGAPQGIHFLAVETERPIEGLNPKTRAWFCRGTFRLTGAT